MPQTVCGTCEPDALSLNARVIYVSCFFLMFCACFILAWFLMHRYYKRFQTLTFAVKADNCSRVNSTIHSILVVPLLAIGIATTSWGPSKEPTSSVAFLQFTLCITIAYFLCDTLVMVLYRVPLWGVYLTHHILAVSPYINYMFVSPCGYGLFLLSCFMLVEFSNYSLNAQAWLEQNGKASTRAYAVCFYITFFGWILCRLVNPYMMIYFVHAQMYPSIPSDNKWCFIPSICCGYLIVVFCTAVFIFVLCNALKKRWQKTESLTEVAPHTKEDIIADFEEDGRRIEDDFQKSGIAEAPFTTSVNCEGMESPTKAIMWEAEKKFDEIAAKARRRADSLRGGNQEDKSGTDVDAPLVRE